MIVQYIERPLKKQVGIKRKHVAHEQLVVTDGPCDLMN